MTVTGPQLVAAGFDVRVPALSRRRPSPSLRVFVDAASESMVGANQLANVHWSAVFDDVELIAADIARLAKEARPLIRSGERWVAIDRADLAAAAEALAERAEHDRALGRGDAAPRARHRRLAAARRRRRRRRRLGRRSARGRGRRRRRRPAGVPDGFVGELRSYQSEALAWLGFLDKAGLGGCLALDMGLGKTPTMLAHLLAGAGAGPALVIAPPAVVGNWTAEAARFTPGLRVVVHHGARRAAPDEIAAEVADADVVVTTYGTAVRDVEALAAVSWARVVLDEAQAIKNPANDTSQQLRRIPARSRIALTGTPIENGLGDLWAILDFANPGLVGPRPQFIARLSSDGTTTRVEAEDALHALNGILVFRRTKAEPMIAAELPDQIDELDRCAMTPEQIGMYQALLDTLVTGTEPRGGREAAPGPDPRGDHRAQADLQPPVGVPARRPPARRPFGQARPARGDRRRGVRGGRARAGVHALRRVGPAARRAPHRAHRHAGVVLPRRLVAHRPRPAHQRVPDAARARARSCCR